MTTWSIGSRDLELVIGFDQTKQLVLSFDSGALGVGSGELLMQDGVELLRAGGPRAHIIVLTAR